MCRFIVASGIHKEYSSKQLAGVTEKQRLSGGEKKIF
jgi:hypothetical protein